VVPDSDDPVSALVVLVVVPGVLVLPVPGPAVLEPSDPVPSAVPAVVAGWVVEPLPVATLVDPWVVPVLPAPVVPSSPPGQPARASAIMHAPSWIRIAIV
jgi:hypothetical protein